MQIFHNEAYDSYGLHAGVWSHGDVSTVQHHSPWSCSAQRARFQLSSKDPQARACQGTTQLRNHLTTLLFTCVHSLPATSDPSSSSSKSCLFSFAQVNAWHKGSWIQPLLWWWGCCRWQTMAYQSCPIRHCLQPQALLEGPQGYPPGPCQLPCVSYTYIHMYIHIYVYTYIYFYTPLHPWC